MGRPRTANKKIPDLPRGMRKVGTYWYWRGTDVSTIKIADALKASGLPTRCGKTPVEARRWWELHVGRKLATMMSDGSENGTVEELIKLYEAEDLAEFKREETRREYAGRIKRLRLAFGTRRYPTTQADAMLPEYLRDHEIQKHLHRNISRGPSANRDVQLLSRIFRLAKSRWGKTAYNPCEDVEYLPEHARDVYVKDDKFNEITSAGNAQFQCMARISYLTGARIGSVYTIGLAQITDEGLVIRIGKKKNGKGYTEKTYTWTPDLRAQIDAALAMRQRAIGSKEKMNPVGALFLTRDGMPYSQEAYKSAWARVRKKLGLGSREITVHDLGRAKGISDCDTDEAGQELAHHEDIKVTKRVYRRKQIVGKPLPAVWPTT